MKEAVNSFIIDTVLINPIKDIVGKLESGDFRDCDIVWLNKKLDKYVIFAAETFGIKDIITPDSVLSKGFNIMNSYVAGYYFEKFNTLLEYFKSFNK
jgi:hypothetical protein